MSEGEPLEQIERLLVLNLVDGKESDEAIKLLYRAEYTSSEIGEYIGLNPSTVRTKISRMRDAGEIDG